MCALSQDALDFPHVIEMRMGNPRIGPEDGPEERHRVENFQRTATGGVSAWRYRAVMTFALSACWSSAIGAQRPDSLSVISLEDIVIRASRTAAPASQLPGHVTVIDVATHQTIAYTLAAATERSCEVTLL